jgi:hypothetical protein
MIESFGDFDPISPLIVDFEEKMSPMRLFPQIRQLIEMKADIAEFRQHPKRSDFL